MNQDTDFGDYVMPTDQREIYERDRARQISREMQGRGVPKPAKQEPEDD